MRILNAANPRIVSRYFSRYSAQMTMTKYPLISASLSARGVATSPGISVIAAEEAAGRIGRHFSDREK